TKPSEEPALAFTFSQEKQRQQHQAKQSCILVIQLEAVPPPVGRLSRIRKITTGVVANKLRNGECHDFFRMQRVRRRIRVSIGYLSLLRLARAVRPLT